jgi:hypothetical protein
MSALALFAPALALALLAAHFYRAAAWPLVLACLAVALLLPMRRAWVPRLVQIALLAGAAEWLRTAFVLAQQRIEMGQPWARMALLLGGVAVFTAAAALVFRSQRLRDCYAAPTGDQ